MRVAGIIAECNPLHEGHRYLIKEARDKTCAEYIVVALSGDYVQRGAPSILSRESRTEALLSAGADLVVELPLYAACSGADYFARGAVALMENLGVVTDLVFGSETGDTDSLMEVSRRLNEESEQFRTALTDRLREGLSYPSARASAMTDADLPSTPNDLLGTEYLRALQRSGSAIRPLAVKRTNCIGATQIRSQMIASRQKSDPFLCRDDFSDLLLHALYSAGSPEALTGYLDVSPDLAGRIFNELPGFTTYSDFCAAVKTRNYTYNTMRYFDTEHSLCGWIRPIGFRREAAPLIRGITISCQVPFLDKLSRAKDALPEELYKVLLEELQAEFLYDLMASRRTGVRAVPAFSKPLIIKGGRAQCFGKED